MGVGDVMGHETMGEVVEVGTETGDLKIGDRVSIPFQISCGHCWMCDRGLYTSARPPRCASRGRARAVRLLQHVRRGARRSGRVPARAAGPVHPHPAARGPAGRPVRLPLGHPAHRVAGRGLRPGARRRHPRRPGPGPVGDFAAGSACTRATASSASTWSPTGSPAPRPRGRGRRPARARGRPRRRHPRHDRRPRPGLRARRGRHGGARLTRHHRRPEGGGLLPSAIAAPLQKAVGVDRLGALYSAIDIVRRGGTVSLSGVYGGAADPMPLLTLFDKQIALHMGQCNVKKWVPEIMPLLTDDDPLGVDTFASHRLAAVRGAERLPAVPGQGPRLAEGAAQARRRLSRRTVVGGDQHADLRRPRAPLRRCPARAGGAVAGRRGTGPPAARPRRRPRRLARDSTRPGCGRRPASRSSRGTRCRTAPGRSPRGTPATSSATTPPAWATAGPCCSASWATGPPPPTCTSRGPDARRGRAAATGWPSSADAARVRV